MKPIEKGCLAVVTIGIKRGMSVIVGKYIGNDICLSREKDLWEIDKGLPTTNLGDLNMCPEKYLLRIDGGEFEEDKGLMRVEF